MNKKILTIMELCRRLCVMYILFTFCVECRQSSSEENDCQPSIPDTIDINDTELIQALIENTYEEGDSNIYKSLREDRIVLFPTIIRNFKSLNPDSLAKEYGSPIYEPNVVHFRPSKYDETYCKRWHTNRFDNVYYVLSESNTIVRLDELTPILSRIDEFRIADIAWAYNDDLRMEVIYLISDTTLIPIDGWIANKEHFIFKRI